MKTPRRATRSGPSKTDRTGSRPGARKPGRGAPAEGARARRGPGARPTRDAAGSGQGKPTLKRPGIAPDHIARILGRQPWGGLEPLLEEAGLEPGPVIERLRAYATLLIHWNRSVSNLVSQNDEQRFVERHLGESLGPLSALRKSGVQRWLDIGSGGGLPAIPLALAGVGSHWTLVESRRMKTLFLSKVKQEMGLDQIDVVCARIENMDPGVPFDGLTSRATLKLGPTLSLGSRFVAIGGSAFLWKGERRAEELHEGGAWASEWQEQGTIALRNTPTVVVSFIRKRAD